MGNRYDFFRLTSTTPTFEKTSKKKKINKKKEKRTIIGVPFAMHLLEQRGKTCK